ncbi:MAG: NERD domain-containing protein [Lachnospiraceae bacterium]|jgi:hypothetical protein|nr:NERD domain-containing protein [Lachnospiraceae bacterium]MCI1726908.1 NERD domain-containing protein [Lachnospiraceae bacterium]
MSKGLIDRLLDEIFDANWVGCRGEKLTERELNLVKLFGRSGKVLRNLYVPKTNGETSEIDVVFICRKGIFVIESKNYSGWVFGDEKSAYWTVMLPNRKKNRFYNPILQNRTHLKWLRQYLDGKVPLFSIVAFSERCELKKVTVESSDIHVIKRDRLYATVRNIWDESDDVLDEDEVTAVYEKLEILTHADQALKEQHIEDINEKYKKPVQSGMQKPAVVSPAPENSEMPDLLVCPKCGGKLILRMARQGANAGRKFYGCSNYPKCRYTRNAEGAETE